MKASSIVGTFACLLAGGMLVGCAPQAQVKDVLANQSGYLDSNFSPDNLSADVRTAIAQADDGPLPFRKMVLKLDWTVDANDKAKAIHVDQTLTLTNAGGSFTRMLSQDSRNGIPISQQDSLSYRGLLQLRTQHFSMGARAGNFIMLMHRIQHFDPIMSSAHRLEYDYTVGSAVQIMNFRDVRISCDLGAAYPASRIYAGFKGEARDAQCTMYGANGAVARKDDFIYFAAYGIALRLKAELASGMSEARLVSAQVL